MTNVNTIIPIYFVKRCQYAYESREHQNWWHCCACKYCRTCTDVIPMLCDDPRNIPRRYKVKFQVTPKLLGENDDICREEDSGWVCEPHFRNTSFDPSLPYNGGLKPTPTRCDGCEYFNNGTFIIESRNLRQRFFPSCEEARDFLEEIKYGFDNPDCKDCNYGPAYKDLWYPFNNITRGGILRYDYYSGCVTELKQYPYWIHSCLVWTGFFRINPVRIEYSQPLGPREIYPTACGSYCHTYEHFKICVYFLFNAIHPNDFMIIGVVGTWGDSWPYFDLDSPYMMVYSKRFNDRIDCSREIIEVPLRADTNEFEPPLNFATCARWVGPPPGNPHPYCSCVLSGGKMTLEPVR
ncbi:MAG: hypothetical protein QW303_00625 [Nitrososphaerota archaeon]